MGSLLQDFRYATRALIKQPGYAALAVVALGLGIGLNTSVFSVADVMLFRPLLLKDMDRLVQVDFARRSNPNNTTSSSPKDYYEWRDRATSFEYLSAYDYWDASLTGAGEPERVRVTQATWEFFRTIGVEPVYGRAFREEEDMPGRERVAVLSYELWERRFGADQAVLGDTISLDGRAFEVIGIAPRQTRYPPPAELWVPLALTPEQRETRDSFWLNQVGRLKPGATLEQARAEMTALGDRTSRDFPDTHKNLMIRVDPLNRSVSSLYTAQYTELLLYAVGFVLLIACLNVAGLQLSRLSGRAKELTIRLALGAGRWRVLRIVLAENLLVALGGAGLGLLCAYWGVELIKAGMPPEVEKYLPGWHRMAIDARALLFTMLVSLGAGLAAGFVPSFLASRLNLNDGLKESSRGATGSRRRHRLRGALAVVQIVFALVLLIGAGLMVQGFRAGADISPGLNPDSLLTFRTALADARFPERADRLAFHRRMLDGLAAIPGVESVGLVYPMPYSGSNWGSTFTLEHLVAAGPSASLVMQNQFVSKDYFRTMRIRLLDGRLFDEHDVEGRPEVAIVNESFARRYYPEGNAVGSRMKLGFPDSESGWIEIVGVVSDVRFNFTDRTVRPTDYRPQRQVALGQADYALRIDGDPLAVVPAVRRVVAEVDPWQPIYNVRTMTKLIRDRTLGNLYVASFMSVFGIMALILALMGVYGILAQNVMERTGEIGIRMAMGARASDILRMVLRRGLAITGVGLLLGVGLSIPLAHAVSSLVFGVSPYDAAIFGGVLLLFLATGALACFIPARRAAATDPTEVLRYE